MGSGPTFGKEPRPSGSGPDAHDDVKAPLPDGRGSLGCPLPDGRGSLGCPLPDGRGSWIP